MGAVGLGDRLCEEVRRRVAQATRFPTSGAPAVGLGARYGVRSYKLQRFRCRVIAAVVNGTRRAMTPAQQPTKTTIRGDWIRTS